MKRERGGLERPRGHHVDEHHGRGDAQQQQAAFEAEACRACVPAVEGVGWVRGSSQKQTTTPKIRLLSVANDSLGGNWRLDGAWKLENDAWADPRMQGFWATAASGSELHSPLITG